MESADRLRNADSAARTSRREYPRFIKELVASIACNAFAHPSALIRKRYSRRIIFRSAFSRRSLPRRRDERRLPGRTAARLAMP